MIYLAPYLLPVILSTSCHQNEVLDIVITSWQYAQVGVGITEVVITSLCYLS